MNNNEEKYTAAGTNIDEVKRENAASGLSYNEVKEMLAKTGGQNTAIYSDQVKGENQLQNNQ
ncbi:MAG: gamma-type small acid-soluble spore protein [Lysinibacillus sp.]